MIDESFYWKRELFKIAVDLRRRRKQRRWPDASLARVELNVMLGFYMIRKLLEARKVSDSIAKRRLRLQLYPATGKRVTYRNTHRIEDLYDFSRSHSETRTVAFICDQVIHSYIFVHCLGEPVGWDGVIFASDRQKSRGVFYLRGRQLVAMFESVARNDPAWIRWQLDPRTGEERMKVGPHLPMPVA
jgi:hypothetical protein